VVATVNEDGSFAVAYDDGDYEASVIARHVKVLVGREALREKRPRETDGSDAAGVTGQATSAMHSTAAGCETPVRVQLSLLEGGGVCLSLCVTSLARSRRASANGGKAPEHVPCGRPGCSLPLYHLGVCCFPGASYPQGRRSSVKGKAVAAPAQPKPPPLCAEGCCEICFEAADSRGEPSGRTHCGHIYHRLCLEQWMRQKAQCPVCRSPLFSRKRMFVEA